MQLEFFRTQTELGRHVLIDHRGDVRLFLSLLDRFRTDDGGFRFPGFSLFQAELLSRVRN